MPPKPIEMSKMSVIQDSWRQGRTTRSTTALSDGTCRQIVRVLHENSGAVTMQDIADQLADSSSAEPSHTDAESIRVRLHHVHLPKLADHGLVLWDEQEQTVSATDHPVYESDRVEELPMDNGEDRITEALTDDRRREILAIVTSQNGAVTREALARKLARRETDKQPAKSLIEDIEVQLHHRHLPKLDQAGLVEYDLGDATVEHRA